MDFPPPPSYTEASHCPGYGTGPANPSTPPPSYCEAVGGSNDIRGSPFPVLNIPTEITVVHQTQQVVVQQTVHPTPPPVIAVQPQPVQPRVVRHRLGDRPTVTLCPYCRHQITTVVEYKPGAAAWGMCFLLVLLGLICGFCLIPFCVSTCQDAHHSCPHCNRHLGIHVR